MFIHIQHPGEAPNERRSADAPRAIPNWLDFNPQGRPCSAAWVIRRNDGGVIGTSDPGSAASRAALSFTAGQA